MLRVTSLMGSAILLMTCGLTSVTAESRKFDEYGHLPCDDEMTRLNEYAIELQNNPDSVGYIFAYAGRLAWRGEAKARLTGIRNYLINKRGLSAERVKVADGGHREDFTVELYVNPGNMVPPEPVPTVDPKEVKFKKGKIKSWELSCD